MVMNQLFRELGKSRCPEGRGDWLFQELRVGRLAGEGKGERLEWLKRLAGAGPHRASELR